MKQLKEILDAITDERDINQIKVLSVRGINTMQKHFNTQSFDKGWHHSLANAFKTLATIDDADFAHEIADTMSSYVEFKENMEP